MHREDQLVQEIPVYLSNVFGNQLCVMHYPLIPVTISLANWNVKQVKVKSTQDKFRLTMEVDTSIRYDKKRETRPVSSNEDADIGYIPPERERIMETSIPVGSATRLSRYVVGVIQGEKLFLSSLKSIVEMRDILPHLNVVDVRKECDDDLALQCDDEDLEPTKINVKFSQVRQSSQKPKYVRNYSLHNRHHDEDPWICLNHLHDPNVLRKMSVPVTAQEHELPFYYLSSKDYLNLLFPKIIEVNPTLLRNSSSSYSIQHQRLSVSDLKNLSIQDQVSRILVSAKLLRYSELVELLTTRLGAEIDHGSLLHFIQTVAVLIQGCWVVKSDVLYSHTFISNTTGIPGTEMQRGRDLILDQFRQKRLVERHQLCKVTRLPIPEVTEILTDLAVVVPKSGWEFKYVFDAEFCTEYSDVVQKQKLLWEMKNMSTKTTDVVKSSISARSFGTAPVPSPGKGQSRTVTFSVDTKSPETQKQRRKTKSHRKK